jgi:hypothetical protein
LDQEKWNIKSTDKDWNITEIICHLRDVDGDVNLPRIKTILTEAQPFIAGVETDRWAEERDYYHQDGRAALKDFLLLRQKMIQSLVDASAESWQKPFRHTIFGPSTLQELMAFTIAHDNNHICQIKNLLV